MRPAHSSHWPGGTRPGGDEPEGPASRLAHRPLVGAHAVARQVLATAPRFAHLAQPVLVNGEAGAVFGPREEPIAVIGFTIAGGRVAALNLIADTAKLQRLAIQP